MKLDGLLSGQLSMQLSKIWSFSSLSNADAFLTIIYTTPYYYGLKVQTVSSIQNNVFAFIPGLILLQKEGHFSKGSCLIFNFKLYMQRWKKCPDPQIKILLSQC